MDEEAQKRNTDCVYFLASPLTCKKGNECEYRHSESARINPRDCWYWLSGTCLNTNCPFRHPPLEGRPAAPATAGKSRVPCYFFGQGFCAKGDKCTFMHGMAPPPNSETVTSQKVSKPIAVRATDSNEKQGASSKGNDPVTSKPIEESLQQAQATMETRARAAESQFLNAKVNQAAQEQASKVNDVVSVRMPEGSASSGPARPRNRQAASVEERSRQVPLMDDRRHQVQPADDNSLQLPLESRMHEAQSGDGKFHQAQIGDERLHSVPSGEERIQNGMESEEWWEESSPGFDVLVDDGPDQLIYAEDIEYLSHHDLAMESGRGHLRGRMMLVDDLADFEYDQSGAYDQSGYYDTSVQYELTAYDPYDQLGYDQLNSYDHVERQSGAGFKDRQIEGMLLRERRGLVVEGEFRRGGSSGDLRNHIVKRRRAERSQGVGDEHYRRRHQDALVSDFQQGRRHQDNHSKQQEVLARHRILAQPGTRAHRRSHGRSESRGNKRTYRDIGSDYEGISLDKSANKKSRNSGEHVKAKSKRKERGWLTPEVVEVSETKNHVTTNHKRHEPKKNDSTFAGPKTLAQIKAEKMKAGAEENSRQRCVAEEVKSSMPLFQTNNLAAQRHVPPLKSQISPVSGSGFDTALKTGFVAEDRKSNFGKVVRNEARKVSDFEGPKTLSAILKAKRKGDADGDLKVFESRKDQIQKRSSFQSDVEDGELLQDTHPLPSSGGTPKNETRCTEPPQQGFLSYREKKLLQNDVHMESYRSGLGNGPRTELVNYMEDGVEGGDNAIEDVDFDDDDEDDEFARKLGGFFT